MLEYTELDNQITKSQLSKTFPNKVNIGFGLDANKIKGVSDFPIYSATDGFESHAKKNVDSFMFHTSHKYDVPKPSHTTVGEIRPYLYDKESPSQPKDTNVRIRQGELSALYGLPPDKTIVLENPTAQAMGKTTAEQFMVKQWQNSSGLPPALQSIVDGDVPAPPTAVDAPTLLPSLPPLPVDLPEPRVKRTQNRVIKSQTPVVLKAFGTANKTPQNENATASSNTTEELPVFNKDKKEKVYALLKSFEDGIIGFTNNNISDEDRAYLNKLLSDAGYITPTILIKKISTYLTKFKYILDNDKGKVSKIELKTKTKTKTKSKPKPVISLETKAKPTLFLENEEYL